MDNNLTLVESVQREDELVCAVRAAFDRDARQGALDVVFEPRRIRSELFEIIEGRLVRWPLNDDRTRWWRWWAKTGVVVEEVPHAAPSDVHLNIIELWVENDSIRFRFDADAGYDNWRLTAPGPLGYVKQNLVVDLK